MDMEWSDSKYEHREERDDESPMREHYDDLEQDGTDKSSKHRSKDRKKGSREGKIRNIGVKTENDQREEREKESSRDRRKDDRDEREKDRSKDSKVRDKEYDREKYREKERDRDKDRKDRGKDRERERERERDAEKDSDRGRDKERVKEKNRDRDRDKEREKERDRPKEKERERREIRSKSKLDHEDNRDRDASKQGRLSHHAETEENTEGSLGGAHLSASELEERILNFVMVSRSRKLEEKRNAEKEKALRLSKIFAEQDNIRQGDSEDEEPSQDNIRQGDSEDEEPSQGTAHNLAGVKVLHGIDKVVEGGAVVLTLKDQNILANGDINEEIDMLENVELGEQKQRDEAYKAAKKKTGIYDDKFNDDPSAEKKMLPQYDDPTADEGLALDERGLSLAKQRKNSKRLEGASNNIHFEDLNAIGKITSDYYTQEEMLKFKKPKKKKSLRKKEKLDLDALEAEALSSGLGVGDLGSRNDARRQAIKEEQERAEAELRKNAYQSAYAKADEASKSLRMEQTLTVKLEEDENPVFADEDDDLYKSLERARKLALKKQEEEAASGPQAIARLATTASSQTAEDLNPTTGESQENKVVFTEMEEFVWGLQLDEEARKPENEDVFMQEDEEPRASNEEVKDEAGGWTEVKDVSEDEHPADEDKEEIVPDEAIHEVAVGKGLSGALKLLKDRGTLKESIEWGGRNMDKKKSKLVGIVDDDEPKEPRSSALVDFKKEIRIERTDEFGRIMTPKEAFRMISHKFHGKGPGKMKLEKRMKQYHEELKLKRMENSDTPSKAVEKMKEAQMQLKTPYLVLSGHVKPGQTSDPRSGFATVEKDFPGGLTPMLGDRKVEHFLGIKRKTEPANSAPKKPKP
ncbi:sart-1 family protein dot2 [Quercus suber]|uniref:Sart-1 family protein dot2 n=1 Tax=Quercus suber TaxID=58331 RepID=A0AAW0MCI6_QUESU